MKKVAIWMLILSALTPLAYFNHLLSPGVDSKVLVFRFIACVVSIILTLILFFDKKDKEEIFSRIHQMVHDRIFQILSLGIIFMAFSTFFAFDPAVAFFGELTRAEGFTTIAVIYVFFLFFYIFFKKSEWQKFFMFSSVVVIALFLLQCIQILKGFPPEALSGNSTFLAGYYITSLFGSLITFYEGNKFENFAYKYTGAFAFVFAMLGIILNKTRGAMLGLFLAVVVCLVVSLIFGKKEIIAKKTISFWAAGLLSILILFSAVFITTRKSSFWQHIPGIDRVAQFTINDSTANSRFLFAKQSLTSFWGDGGAKRIIFGWGWDNYVFFFQKHYNPEIFYYDQAVADRAHNKLIDMLVMTGLTGLITYLIMWGIFISRIIKRVKDNLIEGLTFVFFAVAYATFLFFTFDISLTLFGFYAVLSLTSYQLHE